MSKLDKGKPHFPQAKRETAFAYDRLVRGVEGAEEPQLKGTRPHNCKLKQVSHKSSVSL